MVLYDHIHPSLFKLLYPISSLLCLLRLILNTSCFSLSQRAVYVVDAILHLHVSVFLSPKCILKFSHLLARKPLN